MSNPICDFCGEPIEEPPTEVSGGGEVKIYHAVCYLDASSVHECLKCRQRIEGRFVSVRGGKMHSTCFVCDDCGVELVGRKYKEGRITGKQCIPCWEKTRASQKGAIARAGETTQQAVLARAKGDTGAGADWGTGIRKGTTQAALESTLEQGDRVGSTLAGESELDRKKKELEARKAALQERRAKLEAAKKARERGE